MTPKEKAEQIQKRFKDRGYINDSEIKEMSLIVANEVTEQWEYVNTHLADLNGQLNPNLKYWYDVIAVLNAL
jgi:hypothetical protein